jgi:carboxymethylenebutenolidase
MSQSRLVPVLVAALVLPSGCSGVLSGDASTATPTETPAPTSTETPTAEASYTQTPYTGCQPGSIRKDGTCEPVTTGGNADIFSAENLSAITTERTTINGTPGYLARPADDGEYPAVVMIHEWWGLSENIEHMAEILAGHGYVVFAVDLYDGEVAENSSEAARLSGQVRENPDAAVSKMGRAMSGLRDRSDTTERVASLGWCFGGGQSLQLSLSDADLNATVIYYGTLTTDRERRIKYPGSDGPRARPCTDETRFAPSKPACSSPSVVPRGPLSGTPSAPSGRGFRGRSSRT